MRRVTGDELKEIQLRILDHVAAFCEEHEIPYFLDCGTLLGAIRHKGYIPWDDDIDVGMLREDYERFVELFNEHNDQYYLFCPEKSKDGYYAHGKVLDKTTTLYEPDMDGYKCCINIDIFIYDNVPSKEIAKKVYAKRDKYQACHFIRFAKTKPSGNVVRRMLVYALRWILDLPRKDYFIQKMVKNAKQYRNQETKYMGHFTTFSRMVCEKDVFDSFITAEFEGKHYKVPAGYDQLLRAHYGDYMQLPPEEQRVSHHQFVAFVND